VNYDSVRHAASLDNLITWVDKGVLPPSVPHIETSDDGRVIKHGAYGNALGGYRPPTQSARDGPQGRLIVAFRPCMYLGRGF